MPFLSRSRFPLSLASLSAIIVCALVAIPASAQTTALTFTGSTTQNPVNSVFGWRFSLASPVTITALGIYDFGANGLTDSHPVSIWTTTGTQLLTTTVASGTSAPLDSGFRFSSGVTVVSGSTTLPAGTYIVGAGYPTGADLVVNNVTAGNMTTATGVTYLQNQLAGGVFAFPSETIAGQERGYFGANFQFTAVSSTAPEPATFALLALGIGIPVTRLAGIRRMGRGVRRIVAGRHKA